MRLRQLLFFILIVAVTPSYAERITVDYNKDFSFSSVKTFAWGKSTPGDFSLIERRISNAVESQLVNHGLRKWYVEADLFVVTYAFTREDIQAQETGYTLPSWTNSTIDLRKAPVGTFVVDIVDAKEKRLVWRAVATDVLKAEPHKIEATINKAIEKMFETFPRVAESK